MLEGLKELLEKHKTSELTVEQFEHELNQILPKTWKPASVFNEELEKNKTLSKQLDEYKAKMDEAIKAKTSNEDLQKMIAELKEQHKAELQKQSDEFAKYKKDSYIQSELEKAGAKNFKTVLPLIDTSKINLADGGYIGLKEQLDALKKDENNAYLFNSDNSGMGSQKPSFGNGEAGKNPTNTETTEATIKKAMGL